jgi:hypothetical protein
MVTWKLMPEIEDDDPLLSQKQEVLHKLLTWFLPNGDVHIHDDLTVDVSGIVNAAKRPFPNGELPVKFGEVGGLYVDNTGLKTWHNSPRVVYGHVWAHNNPLENLVGAPAEVHGFFGIPLTKIQDISNLPMHITGVALDYHTHMPLLRALNAKTVDFPSTKDPAPEKVKEIMQRYAGEGKPGAIRAAGELIRAGFKENARW